MLYLDINGRPLLLPAGSTAQIEHISPLFADGIEESYSLPVEVPVQGNAEVLGDVHELSLVQRTLQHPQATLGHLGMPLFRGVLHVLGSNKRAVRTTFSVDGFLQEVRGIRLPTTMAGTAFDLFQTWFHYYAIPTYAEGGPCHFPMFYNPSLYGDANPDWYPSSVSDWNIASTYAINDLVRFRESIGVERTDIWQCTDAGGAAAGESPITHPLKWRRAGFGIVNAWNKALSDYHWNTSDGNFYALVPWFYLKWVIKQSMAYLGYTVDGEFMRDELTHQMALPNTTTLDRVAPPPPANFFRVGQTANVNFVPSDTAALEQYVLPAQAESGGTLQDPDGVWDPATYRFSPDAAGVWRFRVTTRYNRGSGYPHYAVCRLRAATDATNWRAQAFTVLYPATNVITLNTHTFELVVEFDPADVGEDFFFTTHADEILPDTFVYHYWPKYDYDSAVATQISGYLDNAPPAVSQVDNMIDPQRHVPDMEVKDFLIAIADAYNLRLLPDVANKVLYLDYRESTLQRMATDRTDHSDRQVNDPELDHTRNTTGITLKWDLDHYGKPLEQAPEEYDSELDVPSPLSAGQLAFSRATRALYRSIARPADATFAYVPLGYLVPPVTVGDPTDARQVQPAAKPLHMAHVKLDEEDYLMPVLDQLGTSTWFHTAGDNSTLYLCECKRANSASGDVTNVPSARSWGYGWNSADRSATTLLWDNSEPGLPGLYQRHWLQWATMLTTAEAVTMDLLVDLPYLTGGAWQRVHHIHGQDYLVEKLPVEYGGTRGQLISKGAYLLRLRQPLDLQVPEPEVPVFMCSGPGYYPLDLGEGATVHGFSASGYFTLRNNEGTLSTYASGTLTGPAAGTYCLWASDASGNIDGDMALLVVDDGNGTLSAIGDISVNDALDGVTFEGTTLDLSGLNGAAYYLYLTAPALTTVTVGGGATFDSIAISGAALTEASVDALCNSLFITGGQSSTLAGGTSAAPSAASLTNRTNYIAAGSSLSTN